PRGMPLDERGERLGITVFRALDQDRITELLVDERRGRPRVLPNLTTSAQRRLHGGRSVFRHARLTVAGGRRAAPARSPRPPLHVRRLDAVDAAAAAGRRARGSAGRDGRADGRPRAAGPAPVCARAAGRCARRGRWRAPAGTSPLCSLQLRPAVPSERLPELTVVASRACAEAIAALPRLVPRVTLPTPP